MTRALVSHMAARDTAQLLVDKWQQPVERGLFAVPPCVEQRRCIVGPAWNAPILHPGHGQRAAQGSHFGPDFEGLEAVRHLYRLWW